VEIDLAINNYNFKDINPSACGYQQCESSHSFGPAVREHYLIHYVKSGKGTFEQGGKIHHIKSGQIFLIRPFEITFYQADIENPWTYYWIGFNGEQCETLLKKTGLNNSCVLTTFECGEIFENMVSAINDENKEVYLLGKIYELLHTIAKDVPIKKPLSSDYVKRAIDYLDANYSTEVSISKLAGALNIDRRYLSRIFSHKVGVSPQKYLVNIRMEKAANLLAERGLNVGEAARSVGYSDQYNFSKLFKKTLGVSPSLYKSSQTV